MNVLIRVRVYKMDDLDCVVHDRTGNHNDPRFRQWMARTAYWAMRNRHGVNSEPVLSA